MLEILMVVYLHNGFPWNNKPAVVTTEVVTLEQCRTVRDILPKEDGTKVTVLCIGKHGLEL